MPPAEESVRSAARARPVQAVAVPAHGRQVAIDVARGIAVLWMIQTHAFDGWVASEHKGSVGYWLTRVVASVPAPLFLLLSGVGLSLGAQAALRRGQRDAATRWALARRGLGIVAAGYVVSAVYAAIEGWQPWSALHAALFRADILHCIGLSLALCSVLLLRRSHVATRTVLVCVVSLAGGLLFSRWLPVPRSPWLAALVGLFVDAPGYTRFPLLPLVGFCAIGVLVGDKLPSLQLSRNAAGSALVMAVCVALLAWLATRGLLGCLGGALSRSHLAVLPNFVDGAARALATLAGAHWLVLRVPIGWLKGLVQLGSASLFAYAVHIPLCYGRLSAPLSGRLSVAQAAPFVVLLIGLCWMAIRLRSAVHDALRQRSRAREPA
ncbi:MAG: DUF1624 domain-containing protein [Myxococcales bacterium]|nr:DUF1624 domain-containing protein [Myxococcales bacterium]